MIKGKYLILGDIHGRSIWKDITNYEKDFDKIIFLGDYVSTHEGISEDDQITNLEEIIAYKESNPDKVVLLRGNHDVAELGYDWAECYPKAGPKVRTKMCSEFGKKVLDNTQWIYQIPDSNVICSHAGITVSWLYDRVCASDIEGSLQMINRLQPSEIFGISFRYSFSGDSVDQSCIWVRPNSLIYDGIPGYTQIVGHTPYKDKCTMVNMYDILRNEEGDCTGFEKRDDQLWLCDSLGERSYLVINDGIFESKVL